MGESKRFRSARRQRLPASASPRGARGAWLQPTRLAAEILLAAPLVLLACTPEVRGNESLQQARTVGVRVGFSIEPPYAFPTPNGDPTGEAPEILRHIAGELGIADVQWFPLPFHQLIRALREGRIDVIASGMYVTPEREQQVRFSRPTACVRPALVVRRGGVQPSAEAADWTCAGCEIAVLQASVEERALETYGHTRLVVVPDLSTAAEAVATGSVDALVISAPTARVLVHGNEALAVDEGELPERVASDARGCAAFAFRHEDLGLAAAVDSVLVQFVGSARHLEMIAPFGFTRRELPCQEDPAAPAQRGGTCNGGDGAG